MDINTILKAKIFGKANVDIEALALAFIFGGGTPWEWTLISGVAPLSLPGAYANPLKSLIQYGKVEQSATPTPAVPSPIVCNNGTLQTFNFANIAQDNLDIGYYINNNGTRAAAVSNFYTKGFVPVKPNTTYTMHTSSGIYYFNVMEYSSDKTFVVRTLFGNGASDPAGDTITFTTGATTYFLRWGSNMDSATMSYAKVSSVTWMLSESDTAKDYIPFGAVSVVGTPAVISIEPYTGAPQTASVENLFAAGGYADTQDIISGTVERKVVARRLTSDERNWSLSDSGETHRFRCRLDDAAYKSGRGTDLVCTHFKILASGSAIGGSFLNGSSNVEYLFCIPSDQTIDTVDKWKAWLDDNIVIVVYPLAEPTTESVTPQSITLAQGDNTISVVAEIDAITFDVEYSKAN